MTVKFYNTNDIVQFESQRGLQYGVIHYIRDSNYNVETDEHEPLEEPTYLIRNSSGEEFEVRNKDVVDVVSDQHIDGLIALYFMRLFKKARDYDIGGTLELKVETEAYLSSKEININYVAVFGYDQRFRSQSLIHSFNRAMDRMYDQKSNEVKALPAF